MSKKLGLDRQQLSKFLTNQESIRAFEQVFDFAVSTPSTVDEAAALAGGAAAVANQAMAMLVDVADLIEQMTAAPALSCEDDADDFAPPVAVGTLGHQNADDVAITGGALDGTPVGGTMAAAGAFTSLIASGGFGCNTKPAQASVALGAAAVDLATAITLLNNIRTALIANGIGS